MKNKKVYPSIPFKCPNGDFSCPYVNTMTSTLDVNCNDCNKQKSDITIEPDYYEKKQIKDLSFFKIQLKYLVLMVWGGVGYQCYITNHFFMFIVFSLIIGFNIFGFKFIKGVK